MLYATYAAFIISIIAIQYFLAASYAEGGRSIRRSALTTVPISFAFGSVVWDYCLQTIPEQADFALWLFCVGAVSVILGLLFLAVRTMQSS
jgi:hypothetical protein